ncbi:MAG: divergent PAP2 family protein [Candidatus Omnitrophica bacterium]|nr:divergent PAP2 family protein [Candidatus Omnitrophota bacterium]
MRVDFDFAREFFHNQVLFTSLAAWAIAQTTKVALGVIREKKFNFKWFVGTGGMPSSHVAGMMALATSVGFVCGFDSYQFAIAFVVALIVMFDAQGVRRASGRQAVILNRMIDDIYLKKKIEEKKVIEFLGHTPVEVFAGAIMGVLVAIISFKI